MPALPGCGTLLGRPQRSQALPVPQLPASGAVDGGHRDDSTKLSLRTWFLAMYLISQAKTGLSALALKRHRGVNYLGGNYRTAWLINQKVMRTMAERDAQEPLHGDIQLNDAYLGGERLGGRGRGSPNKVPFVAAVSSREAGHPMRVKLNRLSGFTRLAVVTGRA